MPDTVTSTQDGSWHDSDTWDLHIPNNTDTVIIAHDVTLSQNATNQRAVFGCDPSGDLQVSSGATLTIYSGATLTLLRDALGCSHELGVYGIVYVRSGGAISWPDLILNGKQFMFTDSADGSIIVYSGGQLKCGAGPTIITSGVFESDGTSDFSDLYNVTCDFYSLTQSANAIGELTKTETFEFTAAGRIQSSANAFAEVADSETVLSDYALFCDYSANTARVENGWRVKINGKTYEVRGINDQAGAHEVFSFAVRLL